MIKARAAAVCACLTAIACMPWACARPSQGGGATVGALPTNVVVPQVDASAVSGSSGDAPDAGVHDTGAGAEAPRVDEPVTVASRVAVAERIAGLRREAANEHADLAGFSSTPLTAGISVVRWEGPQPDGPMPRENRIRLVAEEGIADVSLAVDSSRDTPAPNSIPADAPITLEGDPRTSTARLRAAGRPVGYVRLGNFGLTALTFRCAAGAERTQDTVCGTTLGCLESGRFVPHGYLLPAGVLRAWVACADAIAAIRSAIDARVAERFDAAERLMPTRPPVVSGAARPRPTCTPPTPAQVRAAGRPIRAAIVAEMVRARASAADRRQVVTAQMDTRARCHDRSGNWIAAVGSDELQHTGIPYSGEFRIAGGRATLLFESSFDTRETSSADVDLDGDGGEEVVVAYQGWEGNGSCGHDLLVPSRGTSVRLTAECGHTDVDVEVETAAVPSGGAELEQPAVRLLRSPAGNALYLRAEHRLVTWNGAAIVPVTAGFDAVRAALEAGATFERSAEAVLARVMTAAPGGAVQGSRCDVAAYVTWAQGVRDALRTLGVAGHDARQLAATAAGLTACGASTAWGRGP